MTSQTPSLSLWVFPPNPAVGNEKIRAWGYARIIYFISVTANNKYNIKETTVRFGRSYSKWPSHPNVAHLPAIYLSKEKVADTLHDLDAVGVHQYLSPTWRYYPKCGTS